jgi:hypothetical protein
MPRPRRMYKEDTGKYYYIINGKRKYVKVPEGVSSKNLARINIQNIIKLPSAQRIKKQGKLRQPKFGKKIASSLQKDEQAGLPLFVFKPGKKIKTLEDLAKESDDTSVDKLSKLLLKGMEAQPSSSKIQPTIASMKKPALLSSSGEESKEDTFKGESKEELPGPAPKPKKQKLKQTNQNLAQKLFEKYQGVPITNDDIENTAKSSFRSTGVEIISDYDYDKIQELYKSFGTKPRRSPRLAKKLETISEVEDEGDIGGAGYDGDGLYNDEIEKIAKKRIKDYVPVIASDQLNELPKYVARGDKRFGFVVNTNPSTSDGSGNDSYPPGHWTAVFINNEDDYPSIEFFDPLAQGKMPEDLIKMCRRIAIKMNPEVMFKYKQNMLRRQSKMTSNCGFHAVKYLDDRYNGVPFSEATGYDDYMESLNNAPDGSRDGEKEIASYIKKYESYI